MTEFSFLLLHVDNPAASAAFYNDLLGIPVVDQLGEDAPVGAKHCETRALRGTRHLAADAAMPAESRFARRQRAHARLPTFLRTCSSR